MSNEAKKYYIPLPKTEQASTGYIEFYCGYQLTEVSEEVYRTYYRQHCNRPAVSLLTVGPKAIIIFCSYLHFLQKSL